jgi:nitroimidazol reductase NimA-like FMN-containing flavoprotein (pyridoxamine 5'-phosphate oxidase superfamily)
MTSKALRTEARSFIYANRAGSLATVDKKGTPHVAVVYCLAEPDLSIYFITRVESRKYENLKKNSTVSMSFSNEDLMVTVQLTGKAETIDDLKESQDIMYKLMSMRFKEHNPSNPPLQLFERGAASELAVVKVTPSEMIYANFKQLASGRYKPFFSTVL